MEDEDEVMEEYKKATEIQGRKRSKGTRKRNKGGSHNSIKEGKGLRGENESDRCGEA